MLEWRIVAQNEREWILGLKKIPYRIWLLVIFSVLLLLSNTSATTSVDRLLHHVPTLALMVVLIWSGRKHPLSNFTYTLIFVFMMLHVIGARYLYSYVPYDDWTEALFGVRLSDVFGWHRNHYDRLVHVSFGLIWILVMSAQVILKGLTAPVTSRLFRLGLFWHFLDIAWVGIFSVVYLPGLM